MRYPLHPDLRAAGPVSGHRPGKGGKAAAGHPAPGGKLRFLPPDCIVRTGLLHRPESSVQQLSPANALQRLYSPIKFRSLSPLSAYSVDKGGFLCPNRFRFLLRLAAHRRQSAAAAGGNHFPGLPLRRPGCRRNRILQLTMSVGSLAMVAGWRGCGPPPCTWTAEQLGRRKPGNVTWVLSGCFLYSIVFSGLAGGSLYVFAPQIAQHWIGDLRTIPALRLFAGFLPISCCAV